MARAMEDFLGDTPLLDVALARIGVVAIHNYSGVLEIACGIQVRQAPEVFVMIIGMTCAVAVNIAAQDGVGVRIAAALHIPVAVHE